MNDPELDDTGDVCGLTFDHDLKEISSGHWWCRRCDAEIIEDDGTAALEPGEPGGEG